MPLPEPPETVQVPGAIFTTSWPVRSADVDPERNLRLDGVARYLQDIGFDNLDANGASEAHPLWIVRRTVIDVVRPIVWPSTVQLTRWCSGLSSRWCNMRVRIESDNGGLIDTEAFWININPDSGMPSRIEEEFMAPMADTATDHRLKWKRLLTEDAPADIADVPFVLRGSDIDPLQHLTNSIYWQPIEDLVRVKTDLHAAPFRAVLEYMKPIEPGSTINIRSRDESDGLSAWFVSGDDTMAIARVTAQ
ncbi:acyl-[acyl-carrier-protein] thioesterase [Antrihabitans cavernicola]|uniref:Acyl-[acyl-carrier-protein] thioesterase n=1 Tax=Antrihabitans cavernicola TaxID=2495913 RepID=A0A5A7SE91_9NOCA|nr:acyl-ACP thioesterase domain-containing protein [Spelaeibacter cavernicola]KAA0024408.1 hypothetical protein FOY51_00080 [Spelaeibacter cavernicola]